jgi:muramidase (phage lysozyme)
MRNEGAIFGLLAIVAGVLLVTRAGASYSEFLDENGNPISVIPTLPEYIPPMYTPDQKLAAFLALIRKFETGSIVDYNILVGGKHFTDMSKHPASPDIAPPAGWILNSSQSNYYNPSRNSSAAGAYQFIYQTWAALANTLGLSDFSPESQDMAAQELLGEIGALNALDNDDVDLALRLASSQWASLPYSNAGQNPKPVSLAMDTYNTFLG